MPARISPPSSVAALMAAALSIMASACQTDPPETQPMEPPASQPDRAVKPAPSPEEPSTQRQQTPDAKELIERAIEYMGGREAFEAIDSWHSRAQMDSPLGGVITLDFYQHGEDQILVDIRIPNIGSAVTARNGDIGWSTTPMGDYQLLSEQQMLNIEDQHHYHTLLLDLQEKYSEISTEGREQFAGEEAWKVRVSGRKRGTRSQRSQVQFFFFDTRTGRVLGMQEGQSRGSATGTVRRFEDWQFFGDLELFTKVIEVQGRETTREYVDIDLNEVDENIFAIPRQVERLLEEKNRDSEVGPSVPPSTRSSDGR